MSKRTPLRLFVALTFAALAVSAGPRTASGSPKDEQALRDGCTWLDRALTREPERDDAFGMFMRGLMPKCQALLEGLARGDKSVRPEGMKAVINEIAQLQAVIDEEFGGPPPATGRPSPDEVARKRVADERAGVDAEAQKKAEAERQAAEAARRAEAEKKAAEDEARRKEAEARAAAEAERRLAEQRAKETEKERKAREAEEKKAEAAARREEERTRKELAAAEKKAAEEAKRTEAERAKAEKKAAEEAKKAEAERARAERAVAAESEREAARRAKERAAEEAEAQRIIDEANREAARDGARQMAEEDAKRRLAEEQARAAQAQAQAQTQAQGQAKTKPRAKGGALDGTWEQPPGRSLDRNIKRALNIFTTDGKIQGEIYEEVWYPAPTSWVDRSCEGNSTFRMVTSARVTGEAGKNKLVLWRDVPRVLTCTCPSRCTVETRRRGFDLEVSPDGRELSDASGVFVRPGTVIVGSAKQAASEEAPGPVLTATPGSFAGVWETAPFKRRDESVVMRLELSLEGDKLKGMLVERSSQNLPLQSWSERFCGGATRWEWVAKWEVEADPKGKTLSLRGKNGDNLTCSCPSKCKKPKDKITLSGTLGATGNSVTLGGDLYEKK